MNLHEYQAKKIFADYGLPVSNSRVVTTTSDVAQAINQLQGDKWIVKVQVHAGGRGKAGGVKLVNSTEEAEAMVGSLLGTNLVTHQTDANGQPVNTMFIEEVCEIERELYLGAVIDRNSQRIVVMASTEGGMEIEEVAANTPEKILTAAINPITGVMSYQARALSFGLGFDKPLSAAFAKLLTQLVKLFEDKDLSLLEINPLVVTRQNELLCLDAKVSIDSNALYRQQDLATLRDVSQEDERELKAQQWQLNYIALDGSVGCMVNGAGLAMATMDLIKLHGGEPANFLDVGGGATAERVAEALKIILSDKQVSSVLINIFGGIVRCDLIADGIIEALQTIKIDVPLIVRLAGNNAQVGLQKLTDSDVAVQVAASLTEGAKMAIAAAGGEK